MYELYDKNVNFICYRMTKRIKNDLGEYDILTARSKKSEKECRKIMDDKIVIITFKKKARNTRVYSPICCLRILQRIGLN